MHWKTGQKKISRMKHEEKKKKARYRKKEDKEEGLSNIGDTLRRNKISIIGNPRRWENKPEAIATTFQKWWKEISQRGKKPKLTEAK